MKQHMKRSLILVLILVFFLLGINIGGKNNKASQIFEDDKSKFEEEIKTPNNNYIPKSRKPVDGLLNKIAKKIDNLLKNISDKIN